MVAWQLKFLLIYADMAPRHQRLLPLTLSQLCSIPSLSVSVLSCSRPDLTEGTQPHPHLPLKMLQQNGTRQIEPPEHIML